MPSANNKQQMNAFNLSRFLILGIFSSKSWTSRRCVNSQNQVFPLCVGFLGVNYIVLLWRWLLKGIYTQTKHSEEDQHAINCAIQQKLQLDISDYELVIYNEIESENVNLLLLRHRVKLRRDNLQSTVQINKQSWGSNTASCDIPLAS